jgi:hypothetical protein
VFSGLRRRLRWGGGGAEPSVPTLAAQTRPPRSVPERPLRGRVLMWPTAAPLVRNSPRGWAPKALPDPEVRVGRAKARGNIVGRHAGTHAVKQVSRHAGGGADASKAFRNRVPATASASARGPGTGRGRRRPHTPALLPLHRIVVRDLGVHPRGEFRTSGAAVGQSDTWAASAAFPSRTRRTCLSSEGGHQGLPARRPSVESDGKAEPREAEGEPWPRCEVRKNARSES